MRLITIKEFRDKATRALKSKEPLIIMRRHEIAGVFFPMAGESIPFEFKKDLFLALTDSIKNRLEAKRVKEEDALEDFERFRKGSRRR